MGQNDKKYLAILALSVIFILSVKVTVFLMFSLSVRVGLN